MDLIFQNLFFANTTFYVVNCQEFSHFSIPGTYTLGVRRTPNQTDSDVTFSRLYDQGKITEKAWKIIMDAQLILGQLSNLSYFNLLDLADFLIKWKSD